MFCYGCIRSPVIDPSPTITTSTEAFTISPCSADPCAGSFTSSGITVTSLLVDSINCIYSIQVSCIDPTMTIITINMNPTLQVASPTTFVCNEMTSTYIFNTVVGSGSINNLQCACSPTTCPTNPPTGPGVDITAPTVDGNCIYTIEATCTNPAFFLIFNMDIPNAANSPQQLTCNNGVYQYNLGSGAMNVNNIECGCRPNPCAGSFTSTGLTIMNLPPDNDCTYSIEVMCTDPTMSIITINMNNNAQTNGPATFLCNIDKYIFNSESINTLQCGCGENTCTVTTEAGVELGTPMADAMCLYTVEVTCTNPAFSLIFNSDTSTATNLPQTLTCRDIFYRYNSPTGEISVDTIRCGCPTNPCENTLTADPDVTVSDPTSDNTCVYTVQTTCNNNGEVLVYDGNQIGSSSETLTCENPPGLYMFNNPPTYSGTVGNVECECPPNACLNSFTVLDADITVSAPMILFDCIYYIDVSCADPVAEKPRFLLYFS